jgi:hypothetical protein
MDEKDFPQGLKPGSFWGLCGTTEELAEKSLTSVKTSLGG